jgi:hypothetical protein
MEMAMSDYPGWRLATPDDVGEVVRKTDFLHPEQAQEDLLQAYDENQEYRFMCGGLRWKYAYVADDARCDGREPVCTSGGNEFDFVEASAVWLIVIGFGSVAAWSLLCGLVGYWVGHYWS